MAKKFGLIVVLLAILVAWLLTGRQQETLSLSQQAEARAGQTEEIQQVDTISTGGPRIEFPETIHDFGRVFQNSSISHTFKVRNVGDAPLELIKAAAS